MWFRLGFQNFIGKKTVRIDFCDVFICDFSRIWHKSLSDNELLSICKEMNPLVEASLQKIKEIVLNFFENVETQKEIHLNDDNDVLLKIRSNIMGLKFQFDILFKEGGGEMFYKEFTTPLLLLLLNIQNREKKLIKILQEKDAEIEDYKQEYGTKSNYLTTKPFIKEEFDHLDSESITWDPSSFLDCIGAKVLSINTIKKEQSSEEPDPKNQVNKYHKSRSIHTDKSFQANSSSKQCVHFDNQTIKKRKKYNNGLKI